MRKKGGNVKDETIKLLEEAHTKAEEAQSLIIEAWNNEEGTELYSGKRLDFKNMNRTAELLTDMIYSLIWKHGASITIKKLETETRKEVKK